MPDILKRFDIPGMLYQYDDMNAVLICSFKLRTEPLVTLDYVGADFRQIVLSVYDQLRIVHAHVVTDKQFGSEVLHPLPVEFSNDRFDYLWLFTAVDLNSHD